MLTKDQQEHFDKVVYHFGMPPEGCTHLDASDDTETTFMRVIEHPLETDVKICFWNDGVWEDNTDWCNPLDLRLYPVPTPPYYNPKDVAFTSALSTQEGGSHYKKCKIQPIEYIHANGLGYLEGNVIKYVTRHQDKNGAEDIKKAIHYLNLILEMQYNVK